MRHLGSKLAQRGHLIRHHGLHHSFNNVSSLQKFPFSIIREYSIIKHFQFLENSIIKQLAKSSKIMFRKSLSQECFIITYLPYNIFHTTIFDVTSYGNPNDVIIQNRTKNVDVLFLITKIKLLDAAQKHLLTIENFFLETFLIGIYRYNSHFHLHSMSFP